MRSFTAPPQLSPHTLTSSFTCRAARWRNTRSRVTKGMKCAASTVFLEMFGTKGQVHHRFSMHTFEWLALSWWKH